MLTTLLSITSGRAEVGGIDARHADRAGFGVVAALGVVMLVLNVWMIRSYD